MCGKVLFAVVAVEIASCSLADGLGATFGKRDVVAPAALGDVSVLGAPGTLFQASLNARVFSAKARGDIYEDAVKAFETHYDEKHLTWQNEYWGKTMLCVAGALEYTQDPDLRKWALEKAHEFIKTYQRTDGCLSTYNDRRFAKGGFDVWGQKYTMWALLELHRVTGDEACLAAAARMMDFIIANLARLGVTLAETGHWEGLSSMTILKPLLLLSKERTKPSYADLADWIVRATDIDADAAPQLNIVHDAFTDRKVREWFKVPKYLAKAYEMMSYFEGVAEHYRATGNPRSLAAVKAFWEHLDKEEINPMRGAGYFDHFLTAKEHVNGMTELCDVVHWIRLNRELWLLTGESKYIDRIEEAFYNAFLAGVSHDGSWGAHIIRSHGTRHLAAPLQVAMKFHQCCPDNLLRTFYDWAQSVAAVAGDGAVVLNLYSDVDVKFPGVCLRVRGGYPVSDTCRVTATFKRPGVLRFRVPYWTKCLVVNGEALPNRDGWSEVVAPAGSSSWTLAFDMSPRVIDSPAPDAEDIFSVEPEDPRKPEGYTLRFMYYQTPEMKGLARTNAAAEIMRGPIVLAKGRLAGTSREETFDFKTVNKKGWKASLSPAKWTAANAAVWGAWNLTLEKDGEKRTIPVADYWSVSNVDDPENWFSLWF